jgi:O-antigen/teichoic acid export membrane protein
VTAPQAPGPESQPPRASEAESTRSTHSDRLRQDMVRGSVWTLASALTAVPVAFVVNVVVVRSLGAEQLGRYGGYLALIAIVTAVLNLGVSDATVQWLAAATARGDRAEQELLVRRCSGYHVLLQGPVLALIVFAVLVPQSLLFAVLGALGTFLNHAFGTASVVMTATARNALSARLGMISGTALQVVIAGSAASTGRGVAVYGLQALGSALVPILVFVAVGAPVRRLLLKPTLAPWVGREFSTYALAAALSGVLGLVVFGRSEILVLNASGLVAASGLFLVAAGLAGQITVPMDSLMGPLQPTAAGLLAIEPHRAGELLLRSMRVTAMLGALSLAVVVPVAAFAIPYVYGETFAAARGAFLVLGTVSCLQSIVIPVTYFALATRRAVTVAWVNGAALAVDLALALTLIPSLGLAGAVIANAASQIVALVLLTRVIAARFGVSPSEMARTVAPFAVAVVLVAGAALELARPSALPVQFELLAAIAPVAVLLLVLAAVPSLQLPEGEFRTMVSRLPGRLRPVVTFAARALPLAHGRGAGVGGRHE